MKHKSWVCCRVQWQVRNLLLCKPFIILLKNVCRYLVSEIHLLHTLIFFSYYSEWFIALIEWWKLRGLRFLFSNFETEALFSYTTNLMPLERVTLCSGQTRAARSVTPLAWASWALLTFPVVTREKLYAKSTSKARGTMYSSTVQTVTTNTWRIQTSVGKRHVRKAVSHYYCAHSSSNLC